MDENTKHQIAIKLTEIYFAPLGLKVEEIGGVQRTLARSRSEIFEIYKGFLQQLNELTSEPSERSAKSA